MLRNENVHDVLLSIEKIGDILNRKKEAARLINYMGSMLDSLRENKTNILTQS